MRQVRETHVDANIVVAGSFKRGLVARAAEVTVFPEPYGRSKALRETLFCKLHSHHPLHPDDLFTRPIRLPHTVVGLARRLVLTVLKAVDTVARPFAARVFASHLTVGSHAFAAALIVWASIAIIVPAPFAARLSPREHLAGCVYALEYTHLVFMAVA